MNQGNLPKEMPPWRAKNPAPKAARGGALLSVAPARLISTMN